MTFQDFKDIREILSLKQFNEKFGDADIESQCPNNKQIHSFDGFWIAEDMDGTFYTIADRSELITKDFDFAVEWFWDNFGKYELMKDDQLDGDLHGRVADWVKSQGLKPKSLDEFDFTSDAQKGMQTYYLEKVQALEEHFEWKREQARRPDFSRIRSAFRDKIRVAELLNKLGGDWVDSSWKNDDEDSVQSKDLGLHIFVIEGGNYAMSNAYADTNDEEKYFEEVETIEELLEQIEEASAKPESKRFDLKHWAETHFEIVSMITVMQQACEDSQPQLIKDTNDSQGTGGFYELAFAWTQEFEQIHNGREWDGEYFEEIENFVNAKVAE